MRTCPATHQRRGSNGCVVGTPVRCLRDEHARDEIHIGWVLGLGDYTWYEPGYEPRPVVDGEVRSPAVRPPSTTEGSGGA